MQEILRDYADPLVVGLPRFILFWGGASILSALLASFIVSPVPFSKAEIEKMADVHKNESIFWGGAVILSASLVGYIVHVMWWNYVENRQLIGIFHAAQQHEQQQEGRRRVRIKRLKRQRQTRIAIAH
jgi:hypothetical protein